MQLSVRLFVKVLVALIVIAIVWIVGYAAYLWFFDENKSRLMQLQFGDFVSSFSNPTEVQNVSYLLALWNGGQVYQDDILDYGELVLGKYTLDYISQNGKEVFLSYVPGPKRYEIAVNHEVVADSTRPIQSLTLSPSGERIVFARMKHGATDPNAISSWEVVLYWNNQDQVLADGFAALFLHESTIALFNEEGISIQNLKGEVVATRPIAFSSGFIKTAVSEDNSRIVWTEGTTARVYTVDPFTFALSNEETYEVGTPNSLTVSPSALYAVYADEEKGSRVVQYSGGEEKTVRTFSAKTAVVKMDL